MSKDNRRNFLVLERDQVDKTLIYDFWNVHDIPWLGLEEQAITVCARGLNHFVDLEGYRVIELQRSKRKLCKDSALVVGLNVNEELRYFGGEVMVDGHPGRITVDTDFYGWMFEKPDGGYEKRIWLTMYLLEK